MSIPRRTETYAASPVKELLTPRGEARGERRVLERIAQPALRDALGVLAEAEDGEVAAIALIEAERAAAGQRREAAALADEIGLRAAPGAPGEGLDIRERVVEALPAEAAEEHEPLPADIQRTASGKHGVRIVLAHGAHLDVGQLGHAAERVEIPEDEVRLHAEPLEVEYAGVRGDDRVALRRGEARRREIRRADDVDGLHRVLLQ